MSTLSKFQASISGLCLALIHQSVNQLGKALYLYIYVIYRKRKKVYLDIGYYLVNLIKEGRDLLSIKNKIQSSIGIVTLFVVLPIVSVNVIKPSMGKTDDGIRLRITTILRYSVGIFDFFFSRYVYLVNFVIKS